MQWNFFSKSSLFLIITLNIWYILTFFEKIHWMAMSQKPIWQTTALKVTHTHTHTHTYTVASLQIFLESNYKLVFWLKKFKKKYSSSFVCGPSGISVLIKCKVAVNSISISHQNSIAKTPFTYFISLRRWVLFFICLLNYVIILTCTPRISVEYHALLLCHFLSS